MKTFALALACSFLSLTALAESTVTLQAGIINAPAGTPGLCPNGLPLTGINTYNQQATQACTSLESIRAAHYVNDMKPEDVLKGETLYFTGTLVEQTGDFTVKLVSNSAPESDNACSPNAKKALARHLNVPVKTITFFNGATVGDGADSIEIETYQVHGKRGLYKVESDAEECLVRNVEYLQY